MASVLSSSPIISIEPPLPVTTVSLAALKKLCALLKNNGDKVLNGQSAFTLTTEVLSQLNIDCRRHSVSSQERRDSVLSRSGSFLLIRHSPTTTQRDKFKAEWESNIMFLKDFMLSTPSVKIIQIGPTLSSPISLHRFGNLHTLELRRVPVHMVEGLHKLRGILTCLIVFRSCEKLKDLLESCGGDMASPMTWSHLRHVSFVCNSISSLDNSLRLLPETENLDLSHNMITSCKNFLENLGDVRCITLAYNLLVNIPTFSLSSKSSIVSLVLRGNNLDNIQGVEELIVLSSLDLGENCLNDHIVLDPLINLTRLRQLQLDGNPLFYHRHHRPLTISCLSRQSANMKFELDKKKITAFELAHFRPRRLDEKNIVASHTTVDVSAPSIQANSDDFGVSASSGIGTDGESCRGVNELLVSVGDKEVDWKLTCDNSKSGDVKTPPNRKSKQKRKRLKARHTEIQDVDHSDWGSSTDGAMPHGSAIDRQMWARREEARKTMKEVEDLRKHYGPNWLQAIEDKKLFGPRKTEKAKDKCSFSSECETDQENRTSPIEQLKPKGAHFDRLDKTDVTQEEEIEQSSDAKTLSSATEMTENDQFKHSEAENDINNSNESTLYQSALDEKTNPIMASIARRVLEQSDYSDDHADSTAVKCSPKFPTFSPLNEDISKNQDQTSAALSASSPPMKNTMPLVGESSKSQGVESANKTDHKSVISNEEGSNEGRTSFVKNDHLSYKSTDEASVSVSREASQVKQKKGKPSAHGKMTSDKGERSSVGKASSVTSGSSITKQNSYRSGSPVKENKENFEENAVCEPMFVTLPSENTMIVIILTNDQLIEKNISGDVTEVLGLDTVVSLTRQMTKRQMSMEDTPNQKTGDKGSADDCVQLDLKFEYIRKDRQRRCYLLEKEDAQIIEDHLKPFLARREEKAKALLQAMMQCLKCNHTFPKSALMSSDKHLTSSPSTKDLQSLEEYLNKAPLQCSKCDSTIVIELDSGADKTAQTSKMVTPVGSYNGKGEHMEQARSLSSLPWLLKRKFSSSSLEGLQGQQSRTASHSGSISGTTTKDSRASSTLSSRERSNAFSAAQRRDPQSSDQGELLIVEDHYSEANMTAISTYSSHQLALMTTSLRGEETTRGKSSKGWRTTSMFSSSPHSSLHSSTPRMMDQRKQGEQGDMTDSGFGSRIETDSLDCSMQTARTRDKENLIQSCSEISATDTGVDGRRGSKCDAGHTNLRTMEHIVNALVDEGKQLEDKGKVFNSMESEKTRGRTISISDLKQMGSCSSLEACPVVQGEDLHRSASGSSIDVLQTTMTEPASNQSLEHIACNFVVGSSDPRLSSVALNHRREDSSGVLSPLNSDICNSMVSSVYETSVSPSEQLSDKDFFANPVVVIGSSDSGKSFNEGEEEGIVSIYDKPEDCEHLLHKTERSEDLAHLPEKKEAKTLFYLDVKPEEEEKPTVASANSLDDHPSSHSAVHSHTPDMHQYGFDELNHRLTLYMMMSLFGNDEEFACQLQSEIVQYIIDKPYEGILVMSTKRFYILKITSQDHSQEPEQWLSCVEIQPIPELHYIDIGLGGQSLRLEFETDCSSYTFITRDTKKTHAFCELLQENTVKFLMDQNITSKLVINEDVDQTTLDNLNADIVQKSGPDAVFLFYCMGYIERGHQKHFPVSFVVTSKDICLVRTNHQWPQPRMQAPITVETVGKQFTILDRQPISNIASVEVCEATMLRVVLELFNEIEGIEACWNITMTTKHNVIDLVKAFSEPWAEAFGVEMDVVYKELDF